MFAGRDSVEAKSTDSKALGDSDTFDDKPRAVTIVSNCPPELLPRLVTGLSECAHNAVTASSRVG
jgi:hypothetical protein